MTIIKNNEPGIIYESQDGGKTVYARESGDSNCILIKEDPNKRAHDRWVKWREILHASEDNVSLKDLVEQA